LEGEDPVSTSDNSKNQTSQKPEVTECDEDFESSEEDVNREESKMRKDFESLDNEALHRELQMVDPVTAMRLHPADRRKVIRYILCLFWMRRS
jgi:tRNA A37 N6-isopentenylltransferase MiaA